MIITMKRKSKFQMTTMSIENTIICFIIGSIFPLQTTSTPMEIAQLVGRNVSLNCPKSSSDGIKWIFNKDNKDTYFYEEGKFEGIQFKDRSRFENDSATGKEILEISGLKPGDAGLYKCLTAGSTETLLQSTQLTVLDSEPTFDSNRKDNEFVGPNTCGINQDDMRFSCAVSYRGTTAPRLQWEDVKNNQIHKEIKCDGSQPNRINCTLTFKAEPQYDGSVFRCKVVTSREQYNCSTKAIILHYFIVQKNDSISSETTKDNVSALVKTNHKLHYNCKLQEDNKETVDGSTNNNGELYRCTYYYNIKSTSCLAVVSDVIAPHEELSWSVESLTAVNILVLFVFAVTSYYFFKNGKVKSNLEKIHERLVTWSKIILIVFAVLDFAALMFIFARPTESLLHMKYAHTIALLLVTINEASSLLLLQCKNKVSSCNVAIILCWVVLCDVGFMIAAAWIFTIQLRKKGHGTIDEWVIIFIFTLFFLVLFALATFVAFVIAKCCCKKRKKDRTTEGCELVAGTKSGEVISDAILTIGWAAEKHKILSELHLAGALEDSDFAKIRGEEDGRKGIAMLVAKIPRGSGKYNTFKDAMKEILKVDLDDVAV